MANKKVLIAGVCGYIGNALYRHLVSNGFDVVGFDNHLRKKNVDNVGSQSVVKPQYPEHKTLDATNYKELYNFIDKERPDAIVWLAEQPSAPFSMRSPEDSALTQQNNIIGTLNVLWAIKNIDPSIHLVKLGTEGEYPDWLWDGKTIPEGNRMEVFTKTNRNDQDGILNKSDGSKLEYDHYALKQWEIPTPRYAGSWYHFSKLHDSMNIDYACKIWDLKATDINQGIVVGHKYGTRLDVDEYFGTVANRFAAQGVIGMDLTVYGKGGQTRGFIALQNSVEAIELLIKNEPEQGEFRVIHQTTEEHSVNEIAEMVQAETGVGINNIENPRSEMDSNDFDFDTSTLDNLGLEKYPINRAILDVCQAVENNKDRIVEEVIMPKTTWD